MFVAAAVSAALAACAQPRTAETPATSATDGDPSSRFIGVIGARAQHAPPFLGVTETNFYCLRSFVDRQTGETRHQVYVSDSYSGAERNWGTAHDETGHALRFVEISRALCGYWLWFDQSPETVRPLYNLSRPPETPHPTTTTPLPDY